MNKNESANCPASVYFRMKVTTINPRWSNENRSSGNTKQSGAFWAKSERGRRQSCNEFVKTTLQRLAKPRLSAGGFWIRRRKYDWLHLVNEMPVTDASKKVKSVIKRRQILLKHYKKRALLKTTKLLNKYFMPSQAKKKTKKINNTTTATSMTVAL